MAAVVVAVAVAAVAVALLAVVAMAAAVRGLRSGRALLLVVSAALLVVMVVTVVAVLALLLAATPRRLVTPRRLAMVAVFAVVMVAVLALLLGRLLRRQPRPGSVAALHLAGDQLHLRRQHVDDLAPIHQHGVPPAVLQQVDDGALAAVELVALEAGEPHTPPLELRIERADRIVRPRALLPRPAGCVAVLIARMRPVPLATVLVRRPRRVDDRHRHFLSWSAAVVVGLLSPVAAFFASTAAPATIAMQHSIATTAGTAMMSRSCVDSSVHVVASRPRPSAASGGAMVTGGCVVVVVAATTAMAAATGGGGGDGNGGGGDGNGGGGDGNGGGGDGGAAARAAADGGGDGPSVETGRRCRADVDDSSPSERRRPTCGNFPQPILNARRILGWHRD